MKQEQQLLRFTDMILSKSSAGHDQRNVTLNPVKQREKMVTCGLVDLNPNIERI